MNKDNAIYTITSPLHDEQAVAATTREFLNTLQFDYDFRGSDYADYGNHALQLIFVRTGGTEGVFRQLLPQLRAQSDQPFYLLASNKSNSLPASISRAVRRISRLIRPSNSSFSISSMTLRT